MFWTSLVLFHVDLPDDHQEALVDFALTSSDVWALWVDDANATVVKHISFEQ